MIYAFHKVLAAAIFSVLLIAPGMLPAQQQITEQLPGDPFKQARIKVLLPAIKMQAEAAVKFCYDQEFDRAMEALQAMLNMPELKKTDDLFRAWVYEWLALNYWALHKDSLNTVKSFVQRSLKEDIDIWPDRLDNNLPVKIRVLYQECWSEILEDFNQKRSSVRAAFGPISRIDFSLRLIEHWHIVWGVGTPMKASFQEDLKKSKFSSFNQLLLFTRVQRLRKDVEKLMGGGYLGFSLEEDTSRTGIQFIKYLSGGPIISYAWQSGLEFGGTFEIARLTIGRDVGTTDLSNTAIKGRAFTLSHGIFELYLRKWF